MDSVLRMDGSGVMNGDEVGVLQQRCEGTRGSHDSLTSLDAPSGVLGGVSSASVARTTRGSE